MFLVTSFTRETIEFDMASRISPDVMSVAINNARRPSELKLVPYTQVLQTIRRDRINVIRQGQHFVCRCPDGTPSGMPCATAAEAMVNYWARAQAKQATKYQRAYAPRKTA